MGVVLTLCAIVFTRACETREGAVQAFEKGPVKKLRNWAHNTADIVLNLISFSAIHALCNRGVRWVLVTLCATYWASLTCGV